jgi:hypothetical protein
VTAETKRDTALVTPLAVPAFTPTVWRSRWRGVVV